MIRKRKNKRLALTRVVIFPPSMITFVSEIGKIKMDKNSRWILLADLHTFLTIQNRSIEKPRIFLRNQLKVTYSQNVYVRGGGRLSKKAQNFRT